MSLCVLPYLRILKELGLAVRQLPCCDLVRGLLFSDLHVHQFLQRRMERSATHAGMQSAMCSLMRCGDAIIDAVRRQRCKVVVICCEKCL